MDFKNMNFADMEKSVYGGNLEQDEELLAELAALEEEEMGGGRRREATTRTGNAPAARRQPAAPAPPGIPGIDPRALNAALADGHTDADDEQLEMDSDLLNELAGLVGNESSAEAKVESPQTSLPPKVPARTAPAPVNRDEGQIAHLRQLHAVYVKMYESAQKAGGGAKARRYQRGVEKLVSLVKAAERGQKIDPSEIPVAPPTFEAVPHPVAPVAQPSAHPAGASIREAASTAPPPLPERKSSTQASPPPIPARQASTVPAKAPETGDPKKAKIRRVLEHRRDLYVANGKLAIAAMDKTAAKEFVTMAKTFEQAINALADVSSDEMDLSEIPPSPPLYRKSSQSSAAPSVAPAPKPVPTQPPPAPATTGGASTFLGALQQRQQRYLQMAEKAKADGNDRKNKMNIRLADQYKRAIQEAKAGRPVDVSELATLPDMPPLPPQTASGPKIQKGPAPGMKPPPEVGPLAPSGIAGKSRNSNQLEFLLQRQNEFKQAAVHAKNHGDIEKAKKYLLEAKGFDKMIQAAKAGLPVSIKETPIPPQAHTASATLQPKIQPSTSSSALEGRDERLSLLEKTLIEQVRLAESNQMRFTRLGDVGKVRLFETWAKAAKQDLLLVRAVAQQGLNLPKFHYEMRQIPSADLFPDLAEDALELTITSCKDVPLPSGYEPHHANIFVRYTFPFPTETPQSGKTKLVSGTTSPEFNEQIMLTIGSGKSRNSKLQRVFKRGGLKLEVYQKGGFMRSDKLLGTCEWKLEKLETNAELEDSLPLKDGRKSIGGLASARVRIREPIGDAKSQSQAQKWLVLDS